MTPDVAHAQAADEEKPSYYLAWIQAESADVAEQYARVIAEARQVAGRAMHGGWTTRLAPRTLTLRTLR